MTTPTPISAELPVVAWLYRDGERALDAEGCGLVYQLEQVFRILPHEEGRPLADHDAASAQIEALRQRVAELESALDKARACILLDRTTLADSHMDPATNQVDEDGQAGLDEYDEVLAAIDSARSNTGGSTA